ncbi:MAG: ABC transporter permease [Phycisphaeraceae bacterium]|nr:ABC transporter permease [Phycisphaeraceae bacterium]
MILRLFLQTFGLALRQIWANKVRAMLTTLGIIIGVVAVIVLAAAGHGFKTFVLDQFSTFGASKVWVFPRMPPDQRDRFSFRQIRLYVHQVDALAANCPSLEAITPVMQINATVQAGDRVQPFVNIQGVRPSWHIIEERSVLQGRALMQVDEDERRQVCLVNDKAIQELGLDADPSGDTLLIEGRRFLVIGVVETKQVSPMFGGNEAQTEIFIPFRTGEAMRPEPRMYAVAKTRSPELFEDARAEIRATMRRLRGLKPEDPDTFGVQAIEQAISQFKKVATGITVFIAGVVSISLLVGGIGIMNIMLVSVSERTREIGLRKAVGARPEVILLQFLVEAVTLCLAGCLVGLALGLTVVLAMRAGGETSPVAKAEAPMWSIVLSVAFSAGTGVIFGMFPAIKAARLDPIVALRHE